MNSRSDVSTRQPDASIDELSEADLLDTAEIFGLLSDPGRLRLLIALRLGEANVGRLAIAAHLSESAASHALRLLRAHRVVDVRRVGRLAFYRLADDHVAELLATAFAHVGHTELVHPERPS
ncbi:metalloregulator ArsR/SmtB family transcription factor [Jatrophihabitans telluris]|uniref:Metalloregulator ArsR/SmtB family transcription factor n=1 Tax=Jatrophihabitans telluris TaxID=2038343 RepID=A0ABY4R422_9ACTN|nr:metalloregulator ArsR/SmtB family transcription factor [Jatrophihabitans telluris]UQX90142.1 metalloregulator ArsR/SmtB family transcription factor [Jatrophihabitans telluris]